MYCTFVRSFLLAVSVLTAAFPALASDTRGVTRDGVLHVLNPAGPTHPPARVDPEELWRLDGEDDEDVVFGVIIDVAVDGTGHTYLLDGQLNEVLVFSPDGEYLRSIGREGEGPGEFRRPVGLFVSAAGDIAVVQAMPGKIVRIAPDGQPAGVHPVEGPDDGVQFFSGAERVDDQLVVASRRFVRRDRGADITESLIRVDAGGRVTARYTEVNRTRQFTATEVDEKTLAGSPVWAAGSHGRVYANDEFDAYTIRVWKSDGTVDRVIVREYAHRVRSDGEKKRRVPPATMGRRGRRGRPPVEIVASDTDRDVLALYPRADGSLWVLPSRGAYDAGEGTIGVFDVFDRDGRFTHQLALTGEGDFERDEFYIAGDRLYVVTNVRAARRALAGAAIDAGADTGDEAAFLAVITYDLAPALQGSL